MQGPVAGARSDPPALRYTERAVASVRRYLPDAELILSTWRGGDTRGLDVDILLLNEDPGADRFDDGTGSAKLYTANRQIISTLAGLSAATRPFAMKLRSDMLLTGTRFLDLWDKYPMRNPSWRVLRERVLTPVYFARNPHSSRYYAFHPSDWWHFGRREDVLALWSVPLADRETAQWYATRSTPANHLEPWALYRYTVEQFLWLGVLRKHGEVVFDHKTDLRVGTIELSELTIVNNLVMASLEELSIAFLKFPMPLLEWETLYTRGDWERLYQRFCAPSYLPAPDGVRLAKRLYGAVIAPVHRAIVAPGSSPLTRSISVSLNRRFPRVFALGRSMYIVILNWLARLVRR